MSNTISKIKIQTSKFKEKRRSLIQSYSLLNFNHSSFVHKNKIKTNK